MASESIYWKDVHRNDENTLFLRDWDASWNDHELILLKSPEEAIVGLFEVGSARRKELKLITIRQDRLPLFQDYFEKHDFLEETDKLPATTYLWRHRRLSRKANAFYKPLYSQGATIGDTAQTLFKSELYLSAVGTVAYGLHRSVTASVSLPAYALGSPNLRLKGRVYEGHQQTWSLGVSYAQSRNSSEKLVNIDILWDSVLSERLVAHSILSAAVVSFDEAKDIAALKSYGSSSIQTGYEYIFTDWSRLLMGPSYNVEQKAIGGYLGYLRIFNTFHLQFSITTTNIREIKLSAREGYLAFIDAYWRW